MFVCRYAHVCYSMYLSVNLSLCTRVACFTLSHKRLARGEYEDDQRTEVWNCRDRIFNFWDTTEMFDKKIKIKKTLLLAVTPIPSYTG